MGDYFKIKSPIFLLMQNVPAKNRLNLFTFFDINDIKNSKNRIIV